METKMPAFQIRGEAYEAVRRYRMETDLQVIQNQLERSGRAIVVRFRDVQGLQQISDVPAPGEATPWYGDIGTGYSYHVRPASGGFSLEVSNLASGIALICSETLANLILTPGPGFLPVEPVQKPASGQPFLELPARQKIILQVPPYQHLRLKEWPAWGEPLTAYSLLVGPLTVGTNLSVRHIETNEVLDLTDLEDW